MLRLLDLRPRDKYIAESGGDLQHRIIGRAECQADVYRAVHRHRDWCAYRERAPEFPLFYPLRL